MFIRLNQKTIRSHFLPIFHSTPVHKSLPTSVNQSATIIKDGAVENVGLIEDTKARKMTEEAKNKKTVKSNAVDDVAGFRIKCNAHRRGSCQAAFESTEAMQFHVASYHAEGIKREFSCHLCKKTSGNKSMLHRHMTAVHMGLKPFKCKFRNCSMAFTLKYDLQRHANVIHTKKIAQKCKN